MAILTKDLNNLSRYTKTWQEIHELVKMAQAGDEKARNAVVTARLPWVLGKMKDKSILRRGHCQEDIWDIAIEAVYKALEDFDPAISTYFTAWCESKLVGILSVRHNFKKAFTVPLPDDYDVEVPTDDKDDIKDVAHDLLQSLKRAPKRKKIVEMYYGFTTGDKMSSCELSEILGCSPTNITYNIKEALKTIRRSPRLMKRARR